MDHPRVGGEKVLLIFLPRFVQGSPPRRRGKAVFKVTGVQTFGITPA